MSRVGGALVKNEEGTIPQALRASSLYTREPNLAESFKLLFLPATAVNTKSKPKELSLIWRGRRKEQNEVFGGAEL